MYFITVQWIECRQEQFKVRFFGIQFDGFVIEIVEPEITIDFYCSDFRMYFQRAFRIFKSDILRIAGDEPFGPSNIEISLMVFKHACEVFQGNVTVCRVQFFVDFL